MYSTQLGEYKIFAEAVVEMRVKTLKIIFLWSLPLIFAKFLHIKVKLY